MVVPAIKKMKNTIINQRMQKKYIKTFDKRYKQLLNKKNTNHLLFFSKN